MEMLPVPKWIRVMTGQFALARPPYILRTSGLGPCIALVLYDDVVRIAGMAHIMTVTDGPDHRKPAKFPEHAFYLLRNHLRAAGTISLKAKIAGGANVQGIKKITDNSSKTIQILRDLCDQHMIKISFEDVLGDWVRSVSFDLSTSEFCVRKTRFLDAKNYEREDICS